MVKEIASKDKKLSFLINNAGLRSRIPFEKIKLNNSKKLFENNYLSHFNITKSFINYSKKRNKRSIVMLGSIVGSRGFKDLSNYAYTKGAIESLTKSIAIEYAKKNIRCNCVSPGFIKTSYYNKFIKNQHKVYKWTITEYQWQG